MEPQPNEAPTHAHRTTTKNPTLTLLSWNCAGLRTKLVELKNKLKNDNIDIVMLQETWQIDAPTIKGYTTYHIPATPSLRGGRAKGGTTTFVAEHIHATKIPTSRANPKADTLRVRLKLADTTVDTYNVYNPCNSQYTLAPILRVHGHTASHQIIMGDLNTHHSAWGRNNPDTQRGCTLLEEILNSTTHALMNDGAPTHRRGNSIDLCILDTQLAATASWQLTDLYSDHHAALLNTNIRKVPQPKPPPRFNLEGANWVAFNTHLQHLIHTNTPKTCDDLTFLARSAMEACIQQTTNHSLPGTTDTPAIRRAKRHKNKLLHKLRTNHNRGTEKLVNIATKFLTDLLLSESDRKWKLWCVKIDWHTKSKQLWQKFRNLQGTSPRPPLEPNPLQTAKKQLTTFINRTDPQLCLPNTHLQSLARNTSWRADAIAMALTTPSDYDRPIESPELSRALLPPRKKTSPGADGVPTTVWTRLSTLNRKTLLPLLNNVFLHSSIPQSWKDATIVPIPKKDPGEFRPISLLPSLGKVMEKIILARLQTFADDPVRGFPEELVGFREGRGTQHAILSLLEEIVHARGLCHGVAVIFLDLEKAFELVDHHVVLTSVLELGVTGKVLAFVKEYLRNRRARVRFQGATSPLNHLKNGVPQGAVLSPFLFNAVVATLIGRLKANMNARQRKSSSILCYADDIAIVCYSSENVQQLTLKVFQLLTDTCRDLGLKISAAKTKAMLMFSDQPVVPLQATDLTVDWVDTFDYLGIRLDHRLTMRPLLQMVASRMTSRLLLMNRISGLDWGAPSGVLSLFYKQAVRALFDYAANTISWINLCRTDPRTRLPRCNACDKDMLMLERIQYRAARLVTRAPMTTRVEILLLEADLPPLHLRGQQLLTNHLCQALSAGLTAVHRKAANYLQNGPMPRSGVSWGSRAVIRRLKLSHELQLADVPNIQAKPPWYSVPVEVRVTALTSNKASYPVAMLRSLADETIARARDDFPEATTVYTDGSLNPDTGLAGAGFYLPEQAAGKHSRVTDFASTLDTELAAILQAMTHLEHRSCIIVTDSLNAVRKIKDQRAKHSLANLIQNHIEARHEDRVDTVVVWIPSHIGLKGNDRADSAALEGSRLPEIGLTIGPSLTKLKATSSRATRSLWMAALHHDTVRNPYSISWAWHKNVRRLLPVPKKLPASVQVAVTRFRTGYRRFADVPVLQRCPCGLKPFHVAHILASCAALDRTDIREFLDPSHNLSDTRAALAILTRMANSSWEPLGRFYRRNYHVIESIGAPEPRSDQDDG